MWVFLPSGFLSVVAHNDMPDVLLCRARVKGDLERLLPASAVFENAGTDYRFRTYLDRDTVAGVIAGHVAGIDYPDFKASVADHRRHRSYFDIWNSMAELQDQLTAKPRLASVVR